MGATAKDAFGRFAESIRAACALDRIVAIRINDAKRSAAEAHAIRAVRWRVDAGAFARAQLALHVGEGFRAFLVCLLGFHE